MNRKTLLDFIGRISLDSAILIAMICACMMLKGLAADLDEMGQLAFKCGGLVGLILWLFSILLLFEHKRRIIDLEKRVEALEEQDA